MLYYDVIASSNPDAACALCNSYGYSDIQNVDEIAECLQLIVSNNGERGLKDVMALHPDKDIILELFACDDKGKVVEDTSTKLNCDGGGCSCSKKGFANFANADGAAKTDDSSLTSKTNLAIMASAVIVAFAIIIKSSK